MKKNWIRAEEVRQRPYAEAVSLFRRHINPGLVSLLEMGEYTDVIPERAEGAVIYDTRGRAILDFVSSYGALNLGHNHPRVLAAVQKVQGEQRLDLSKELLSPYAAFLARNLSLLAPGDLNRVYLCNSGTEAVEAALKLAARFHHGKRQGFVHADNALHGKTIGALSVTGNDRLRRFFPLLPSRSVPFGDSESLASALADTPGEEGEAIAAVILEPIQGEAGVIVPPAGYLREVRELCDRHGVLLILDEIQTGLCRTGTFFACEAEGVVPDIMVLAKSLGGGVATIGATIATDKVYERAYDNPHDCLVQTTTFGGRTSACAAAMAALDVCLDEDLAGRAGILGQRLLGALQDLARRYPGWIREVRGRGLMLGIEFEEDIIDRVKRYLPLHIPGLKNVLKEHLPGMVASALLKHHAILGTLMLNKRSVLRVYPPLIIAEEQLDTFVSALESVLEDGPKKLVQNRVNHALSTAGLNFVAPWAAALLGRRR